MTYASFITALRNQVGDTRRRVHTSFITDGATSIFQMPLDTYPVLDQINTFVVRFNNVVRTENIDFTLDRETGTLITSTVQVNGTTITIDSSAVYVTDEGWLQIINDVIRSLGDDFWREYTNETLVTTANMLSIGAIANTIAVYDFWHRRSTTENWITVETYTNWRYGRESNRIYLSDRTAFTVVNEPLRVRGLRTYILGTAVANTIDVQDRFFTILEYGSIARYWRYRYKNVVELVSKMTHETTRTPLQELIMLSDRFDRLHEIEKAKLKPQKPPRVIPQYLEGSGRP